ncbi:hypothetical protein BHE74_00043720 [Ensete ventricosum]|nr:hypothetical protein BHE74_00043720 [Ensete ventricosum]RZR95508.1 hypothetical protein BHM03_00024369 [Ensete ventricosum]
MKKGKRSVMESSPASTYYPVTEEAKARFRHHSLLQDYEDLLKVGEEMDEYQISLEPAKADNRLRKSPVEGDAMANDLKLSICRDVGHGSNQVVKRKITWQDQVALRV